MRIFFFTYFILVLSIYPKDLDSLFNQFQKIFYLNFFTEQISFRNKCSFQTIYEVKKNFHLFNSHQQKYIQVSLYNVTNTDTFIISPKKYFRINFFKDAFKKPKYNLDSLAIILDSVYSFEVIYLNFPKPKGIKDDFYDIFITPISDYGYTELITENPIRTQIVLSNDFSNYYTNGLEAVKVTLAHEFHHAIQFHYKLPDKDIFFYEMTSTSMEEFVFPEVNDYINYIKSYFKNLNTNFKFGDGYSQAIWNLFLYKQLKTHNFIKLQWEYFKNNDALIAINKSLENYGTNFSSMFGLFSKSISNKFRYSYYDDANLFPNISYSQIISNDAGQSIVSDITYCGIKYFGVIDNSDTISFVISNGNVVAANNALSDNEGIGMKIVLSNYSTNNSLKLNDALYLIIQFNKQDSGNQVNIIGDMQSNSNYITIFPNPLKLNQTNFLNLNFSNNVSELKIYIYDIKSKNIFKHQVKFLNNKNNFVFQIPEDIPTGIYFVYIETNKFKKIEKLAIIK
jgi:hypothetical protein